MPCDLDIDDLFRQFRLDIGQVLKIPLDEKIDAVRAERKVNVPVVLTLCPGAEVSNAPGNGLGNTCFPARDVSTDPLTGIVRRHHVDPGVVNKAIKVAARRAGVTKVISAHTFRHSFATSLLQRGTDIRTIQHVGVNHRRGDIVVPQQLLQQGGQGVPSPLDDL